MCVPVSPALLQLIIVPIYWAKRPGEQATVLAAAERIQEVRWALGMLAVAAAEGPPPTSRLGGCLLSSPDPPCFTSVTSRHRLYCTCTAHVLHLYCSCCGSLG